MENHHCLWENPLFLWPFSIAMLNYQRVKDTSSVCAPKCLEHLVSSLFQHHHTCAIVSCGNGCSILISTVSRFLTSFKVLPLCDFPFTLHQLLVTLAFHGYFMMFGHWCYASACNWGSWPQCLTCHPWCSCWSAHGWESDGHEGHEDWSRSWGRSLWRTPYHLGRRWALHCVPGLPLSTLCFFSISFPCFPLTVLWSDLKHVPHRFLWHVDEKQALCEGLATWIVCQSTHRLANRQEASKRSRQSLLKSSVSPDKKTLRKGALAEYRRPSKVSKADPVWLTRPTWRGGISRHELWGILGNCDLGPWKKPRCIPGSETSAMSK